MEFLGNVLLGVLQLALVVPVVYFFFGRSKGKKWNGKSRSGGFDKGYATNKPEPKRYYTTDDKLDALSSEMLTPKNPVGYKAYQVQIMIEDLLKSIPAARKGRVYPEVGMGAFIEVEGFRETTPKDDDKRTAFYAYNSKRVDFIVIKGSGAVAFAVEYHGKDHFRGQTAPKRDVLKKEALRQAGVELVEILADQSTDEMKALLKGAIERHFRPAPAPFVKEVPSSAERVAEIAKNYGQDGQKKPV